MAFSRQQAHKKIPYPDRIQSGRYESSNLPAQQDFNRELLRVKAHWITDIFPDELVVQEKTISIVRNHFLTSFVETMPVCDIGRVVYINTPFFAGIRILGKNTAHELRIGGLNKTYAMKAKQLIEGLLLEESGSIEIPGWMESKAYKHGAALQQAGKDWLSDAPARDKHDQKMNEK